MKQEKYFDPLETEENTWMITNPYKNPMPILYDDGKPTPYKKKTKTKKQDKTRAKAKRAKKARRKQR